MVFKHLQPDLVIETVFYMVVGLIFFAIAIWVMNKVTPFSIRKEIEVDHNVSLGIIMGAVIIGIAIILAAVLSS
jgi:uncharacterized membrane protein YjfL (UPF0719 family)